MPDRARRTVLHVITSTNRRGAETFAHQLHLAFVERGRNSQILALTRGHAGEPLDVDSLGKRSLGAGAISALRSAARSASVVVAHGSRTLPACAIALAGTGIPFVYRSIGNPRDWTATWPRRLRAGAFLRRADAVVALWPSAAAALIEMHRLNPSRVGAIPNGVPASRFPSVDPARRRLAREELGVDPVAMVTLYVGALSPEKGVGVAITAIASVPEALLIVVGDGAERDRLEALARSVAPGRVHFAGPMKDPATAFAVADIVVLPSWSEGMPAVLIEAGLSALPVVATEVGGVAKVVVKGETGLLVAPGDEQAMADAIRKAFGDSESLGRAARARCLERFEIGVVASQWETVLDRVTGPLLC